MRVPLTSSLSDSTVMSNLPLLDPTGAFHVIVGIVMVVEEVMGVCVKTINP